MTPQDRLHKGEALLIAADRLVTLCADIAGIPFDPDNPGDEWTLDDWLQVALDALGAP